MSPDTGTGQPFEVVIGGGGVAALEAALALRELAPEAARVTLVAPNPEFVLRPMTVREPFAFGRTERYPLRQLAADAGASLVVDSVESVSADTRSVRLENGATLAYDALLLGLGARVRPRYEHVITVDDRRLDELLHGLVQDVEGGYVRRLAFIIPAHMAWPLPVYELALMASSRAYDMNVELSVTILTPEEAPLAVFGDAVVERINSLLAERRIEVVTSAYCEVPAPGHVTVTPGDRHLEFDRIVALPELQGPSLAGLPHSDQGFVPIDEHCQVRGVERVYAAGDATDFAIKHGGIASQQADAAAEAIAALAGADVDPQPFDPVVRGMLLTGSRPLYLSAKIAGGHGDTSEVSDEPLWHPVGKISARYLTGYLQAHDGR